MIKRFLVDQAVLALGVRSRGAFGYGLANAAASAELANWLQENERAILSRLSADAIASDKVLEGFRRIHAKIGKTGKRWLSSPENMMSHVLKTGRMPSINPIVDIYNTISLKTRLALGAHDLTHVEGDITLRLLDGSERFVPLGVSIPDRVQAGEYGYCDDSNDVLCRLEVRQVEKTKVTPATRDCFFIIQGHDACNEALLEAAVQELGETLVRFCGGRYERG
jgi:DNA/RNA-binding domain of Phe-tRNA-synthetase-like protein